MKNLIFTIILFVSALKISGQDLTSIEMEYPYKDIKANALVATIEGDINKIESRWKQFARKELGVKLRQDFNFLEANGVIIPAISSRRCDFISSFSKEKEKTQLAVMVKMETGNFIDSYNNPADFENLRNVLNRFVYNQYLDYYKSTSKAKSKQIKPLKRQKKKALSLAKESKSEISKLEKVKKSKKGDQSEIDNLLNIHSKLKNDNEQLAATITRQIENLETEVKLYDGMVKQVKAMISNIPKKK